MAITFFQFAIALCALSSSALAQRNCYYPGGKLVERDSPCNPTADHSSCCDPGDVCLSNGLCFVTILNILTRGERLDRCIFREQKLITAELHGFIMGPRDPAQIYAPAQTLRATKTVSLDDQNAPSFCKLTLHPQPQTAGQTSFPVGTTTSHNSSTAKAQMTPNAAAPKSSTSPEGTSQTTATTHRRARIHRNRTRIPPAVVVTAQTPQRRTR